MSDDESTAAAATTWHGEHTIPVGQAGRWRIGPLTLWIQRLENEWRVARETGEDLLADTLEMTLPVEVDDLLTMAAVDRFALGGDSGELQLRPATADRPVVARAENTFHLPPKHEATVFVGSPVWLQLAAGTPPVDLLDIPIVRPSDTWFGASTKEGELCYASRTYLRLSLDEIPRRPQRALTAVKIVNRSKTLLDIESIKLPVPHLALYVAPDGQLWTQDVTFERHDDDDSAEVRLREDQPSQAPDATRLVEPRQAEGNLVTRAFSNIFS